MIIFIETRKNNTIIKIEIKVWRRANMDEKKFEIKETVSAEAPGRMQGPQPLD